MERLSTLEKANCNNVWSMKLDIFSESTSYADMRYSAKFSIQILQIFNI